jgi:rRNA maturation endonuclease Nob1
MQDQKSFSLTLFTKKHGFTKIDDSKVQKLSELLNQVIMYKNSELLKQMDLERKRVDQIKEMLDVSSKIRLDLMRDALEMDEKTFSGKIFEWAHQFNFIINGDYLIVNLENVDDFLDNLFLTERTQDKIQCKFCRKLIDPDSKVCPYCGVEVQ